MSRITSTLVIWMGIALVVLGSTRAWASADLVTITRSRFPDRSWAPFTPADAALVGAGRAVDPASGWSANPALLPLLKGQWLRGTGTLLDPRRSDVAGHTAQYSDQSPHFTFGEEALGSGMKKLAWGVYAVQDAFDQAQESFIDTTAGRAPIAYANEFESSLGRGGLAVGSWLGERVTLGAAFEVSRTREKLSAVPTEGAPIGLVAAGVDLTGLSFGGAAGVVAMPKDWLVVAASARAATGTDLEAEDGTKVGHDEVPFSADLGLQMGRGAGGSLLLGATYVGKREVSLGDSVGRGVDRAPRRARVAAGYAYRPAAMPWEFRIGLGWSPYPGEGEARLTNFGVGLGYRLPASVVRVSYAREDRRTPDGVTSARNFVVFGLDLRF